MKNFQYRSRTDSQPKEGRQYGESNGRLIIRAGKKPIRTAGFTARFYRIFSMME
jgi:hypothetical protein